MLLFGAVMGMIGGGFEIAFKDFSFTVPALQPKQILNGLLAVVGIATAISISSWIIAAGNYEKYPSFELVAGIGASILVFAGIAAGIGYLSEFVDVGLPTVFLITMAISASSLVLAIGSYDTYPTWDWLLGVGTSITTFGLIAAGVGYLFEFIDLGLPTVFLISATIAASSIILGWPLWLFRLRGPGEVSNHGCKRSGEVDEKEGCMKCLCGYERKTIVDLGEKTVGDEDFLRLRVVFLVEDKYEPEPTPSRLYACPKCGTVKVILP
jgi:hypothetical protein